MSEPIDYKAKILEVISPGNQHGNKAGDTPLILLSREYKDAARDKKKRMKQSVYSLAKDVGHLSGEEVENLIMFIDFCKLGKQVSGDYKEALDGLKTDVSNVRRKAELLRFVAENEGLSPNYIDSYTDVKHHYPWHWIDAMMDSDPAQGYHAITNRKEDKDFQERLLDRMPSLRKRKLPKGIKKGLEEMVA